MPPIKTPLVLAALAYIRCGFRVLPVHTIQHGTCTCQPWRERKYRETRDPRLAGPCPNPGKHTRISRWQVNATTDETLIRRWWAPSQRPDANVGIATGAGSGIFVLDIDPL